MADIGGSQTSEFSAGINHQVNASRSNDNSITLDGGLQATSDRWNGMSPHGVLQTALGGSQDDSSFERIERSAGYQPGNFETMTDRLTNGSDEID